MTADCASWLDLGNGGDRRVTDSRPTSELTDLKYALRVFREHCGHTPAREFGPLAFKAVRCYSTHGLEVAVKRAKVPSWHPQPRHLYATEVRRVYGLEAAQVLLWYASADVTQVYAERDVAPAARVAAEIG